ncbi:coiled-coil domain-containing protein 106-like [Labeo rohita]|uniref:Coiled-coil domain-containing protein 106-like n=1 Tax=Labeo rohita TaxID=84645 RepID=A0A498LJU8_LABRO|nr:coiled-coil domain-containing protein 106-like [Labeo rohita]
MFRQTAQPLTLSRALYFRHLVLMQISLEQMDLPEPPLCKQVYRRLSRRLRIKKKEIATLKDWVDTIKEERDFLRERLKEALASPIESSGAKKAKKKKSQPKKAKKMGKKLRVKTPDDSIRRYNMVLEKIKKNHISKAEAYARLGVDRNTIVSQAPIAELAATNPDLFCTLRSTFKKKDSLKRFAETCRGFCEQEPTASAILKKKGDGSLLDIYKN